MSFRISIKAFHGSKGIQSGMSAGTAGAVFCFVVVIEDEGTTVGEDEGVGICLTKVVGICLTKTGFPPFKPASVRISRSFWSRTILRE